MILAACNVLKRDDHIACLNGIFSMSRIITMFRENGQFSDEIPWNSMTQLCFTSYRQIGITALHCGTVKTRSLFPVEKIEIFSSLVSGVIPEIAAMVRKLAEPRKKFMHIGDLTSTRRMETFASYATKNNLRYMSKAPPPPPPPIRCRSFSILSRRKSWQFFLYTSKNNLVSEWTFPKYKRDFKDCLFMSCS